MERAIGIRLPGEMLKQIERVSREELLDRSTVIRKFLMIGFRVFMRKKAAEEYLAGKITFSEAAHKAGLTLWELEKYLVEHGFKSTYSIEDLEKEIRVIAK